MGTSTRVSRPALIGAALELIDEHGVSGLNLRALARRLEISAMTPYGYFKDKAALLTAVVDHALEPLGEPLDAGQPWDEALLARMRGLNAAFEAHPGILELLMVHPETPQLETFRLSLMDWLTGAGLPERDAGDALRALTAYVMGYAALRRLRRAPSPSRHSADPFEHGLQLIMSGIRQEASASGRRSSPSTGGRAAGSRSGSP